MLNLSNKLVNEIVAAIRAKSDPEKIVLFGSSVREEFTRGSDIDIALFGIEREQVYKIEDYINQSVRTLREFDIVSFESVSNEKLKERILKEGLVIYERSSR